MQFCFDTLIYAANLKLMKIVATRDVYKRQVATTVLGIRDGVDIVRVHDVTENLRAAKMADAIYR